jgi:hydrophobe/amphiphile efflux-1 (HAE1) family protein
MSRSSDLLGFLALRSPGGTHGTLALSDYAHSSLRDVIKRVPGVGDAMVLGPQLGMRVWLDAERLAALGMGPEDVRRAIQTQNVQAALGAVGKAPAGEGAAVFFSVQATGRLNDPAAFSDIVVRAEADGGVVRLSDVARVELGANVYAYSALYNGGESVAMPVFQRPGSNAIKTMKAIRAELEANKEVMPPDMEAVVVYDATRVVESSIREIRSTLLLTFILVVLVCYLFLQDWRATLVPAVTIPVSVLGAFAVLKAIGFTINTLTLFGLVLAIGSIVDDAIVVVERVQHLMDKQGLDRRSAALQTMREVTGAVLSTTLVLLAIFVPVALMPGITGRVYQQFAATMAVSILFSTLNALTLSPALCAAFMGVPRMHTRGPFGWFNGALDLFRHGYISISVWLARRIALAALLLVGVMLLAFGWFKQTPTAFLPEEDQGAFFGIVMLPDGAAKERTEEVMRTASAQLQKLDGVEACMAVTGFSMGGGMAENVGMIIVALKPWEERTSTNLHAFAVCNKANVIGAQIPNAMLYFMAPPAIPGLGMNAGLDMSLLAHNDTDPLKLAAEMRKLLGVVNTTPGVMFGRSTFTADTPSIYMDVDRLKAETLGVPVASVFAALQAYLGSSYINDINIGAQSNQVIIQSDWEGRATPADILQIHVKNNRGEMVPLGALATIETRLSPRLLPRFNLLPAAPVSVQLLPGTSSGETMRRIEASVKGVLSPGYSITWTGLSYQENRAEGQATFLLAMALLFGYLFLVAQYESWTVPLSVMLSISVAIAGALFGIRWVGMPLTIYAQLGLVLLVALASKNAILIVEFSKTRREEGMGIVEAAAQGAGQRYRAVLMTAYTFVLGVLPMVFAKGAGAAARRAIGITTFSGMIAATVLGILLIPGLYALFQILREKAHKIIGR